MAGWRGTGVNTTYESGWKNKTFCGTGQEETAFSLIPFFQNWPIIRKQKKSNEVSTTSIAIPLHTRQALQFAIYFTGQATAPCTLLYARAMPANGQGGTPHADFTQGQTCKHSVSQLTWHARNERFWGMVSVFLQHARRLYLWFIHGRGWSRTGARHVY